jgi:hypothetical protein
MALETASRAMGIIGGRQGEVQGEPRPGSLGGRPAASAMHAHAQSDARLLPMAFRVLASLLSLISLAIILSVLGAVLSHGCLLLSGIFLILSRKATWG